MLNTFTSIIRLGSDPELKYLPSGQAVLNFNAASTIGFGDKQKTIWLRVAYWRNPGKILPLLKKADQCLISGELSQSEYKANDGTMKTSLELNANIIDIIGKKRESGSSPQSYSSQQSNKRHDNYDAPFDDLTIPF